MSVADLGSEVGSAASCFLLSADTLRRAVSKNSTRPRCQELRRRRASTTTPTTSEIAGSIVQWTLAIQQLGCGCASRFTRDCKGLTVIMKNGREQVRKTVTTIINPRFNDFTLGQCASLKTTIAEAANFKTGTIPTQPNIRQTSSCVIIFD